jgi:hypothetical protein
VDGKFDIGDINLQWIQPYISENIHLAITDGLFSTSGTALVNKPQEGPLTASIKGQVSIDRFSSVDKDRSDNFISWETFSVEDIDVTYNPLKVDIGKVSLNKFNNRLVLNSDGELNVKKIFKASEASPDSKEERPEATEKKTGVKQEPIPFKIGKIELKDFNVSFTDKKQKALNLRMYLQREKSMTKLLLKSRAM